MAKIGDTVRYLNAVGGGKITRIDGKIAYVEEDGFETPVLLKEIVVVMPAGHEPEIKGARLMFDQKAYDNGRKSGSGSTRSMDRSDVRQQGTSASRTEGKVDYPSKEVKAPEPVPEPVELTAHGDRLSLALAFEPSNLKKLQDSKFNAVLVNDSNYTLLFSFLSRGAESREWHLEYSGEVAPNELVDLATLTHENLGRYERVAIQGIAFRRDADFELKQPFSLVRRLDLTKFHKFHCFRPGIYFEDPVIEIRLMDRDELKGETPFESELQRLSDNFSDKGGKTSGAERRGNDKNRNSEKRGGKLTATDIANPHKLLPPVEVDLHISELVDSTAGMDNATMLQMQLDAVRKTMEAHRRRLGQKIIFIHGKGEGVLRKAVLSLLKKEYPNCELQDASFQEYGFGATLVTVHK